MDFHALLAKMKEIDSQPAPVNQMTQECGDPMGAPAMPTPNVPATPPVAPPSMSVNLNAQGMDNIEQMMKLFQKVNPDMMPKAPAAAPMGMSAPMAPEIPPLKMLPLDLDEPKPEMDKTPPLPMNIANTDNDSDEPEGMDVLDKMGDLDDKGPESDDSDDLEGPPEADDSDDSDEKKEDGGFQDATTEPDEAYKSVDYMNNKLAGGMNKPKGTFPKVSDGDNPMQKVRESEDAFRASIRADLQQRLEEAKKSYSATAAHAGKDIGKPGKQFSKISKDAAERYGSKERGEKVAGAVLAKLRKG